MNHEEFKKLKENKGFYGIGADGKLWSDNVQYETFAVEDLMDQELM